MTVAIINVSPPNTPEGPDLALPISFRVAGPENIEGVGVAVRYVRDPNYYVIFDTDDFTTRYEADSTVAGIGTTSVDFSIFEFGGWRGRILEIRVFGIDAVEVPFVLDALEGTAMPPIFNWSGTFPVLANSSADLQTMLDIVLGEDSSHLWQGDATPCLDVGTLSTGNYTLSEISDVSVTTDPSYGEGVRNILSHDANAARLETVGGSSNVPATLDGTTSFIVGGVMQWDSFPGGDVNRIVAAQFNQGANLGWLIFTDVSTRQLIFATVETGSVVTSVTSPIAVPFGTPFAFLCNLDVAGGLIKVMTSVGVGSYAETAWADGGNFNGSTSPFTVGDGTPASHGGWTGLWAQMAVLEYDTTDDAGLSYDAMESWLQYMDGFQTL